MFVMKTLKKKNQFFNSLETEIQSSYFKLLTLKKQWDSDIPGIKSNFMVIWFNLNIFIELNSFVKHCLF